MLALKIVLMMLGLFLMTACTATVSPTMPTMTPPVAQGKTHVVAQQADLVLELELSKNTFYAGEQGEALVSLRNQGTHPVFTHMRYMNLNAPRTDFRLDLLDEDGKMPKPYPWFPFGGSAGRFIEKPLMQNQVLTNTLLFQILPWEQAKGHTFTIHAVGEATQRQVAGNSGNVGEIQLVTNPISLRVIEPGAAQELHVEFKTEGNKYQLRVTDAAGTPLSNPIWVHTEASQAIGGGVTYSGLAGSEDFANGEASGELFGEIFDARYPLSVRGWIAAPGHVTTVFEQKVAALNPKGKVARTSRDAPMAVHRSIAEAQGEASFHIYQASNLPADAQLKRVTIAPPEAQGVKWLEVTQHYRVSGGMVKLRQFVSKPVTNEGVWGIARQAPNAQRVKVHSRDAYLIQEKTRWILDWTLDEFGFELWAPVNTFSLAQVLALAESVK